MENNVNIPPEDVIEMISVEYSPTIIEHFHNLPEVAKKLIDNAELEFNKINNLLCTSTSFINLVKANIPNDVFQAILTDEQKQSIANGAIKLMTKKDGSLLANLVNTETNKIVSNIPLEKVKLSPEIGRAMTDYATQMQLAQIAEQIQLVQIAVEEVRQGQEYDRLATAYSCQQKFLQAMSIKNHELRESALLRIALDAEDSRNLLMQTQKSNVSFIKNEPESTFGKLVKGANPKKINARISEIRDSLCAVNMVSLVEAMAYQEMDENDAAQASLKYYEKFIGETYIETKGLLDRLDLIDPSPENYWSKSLPEINNKIKQLPVYDKHECLGDDKNEK